MKSRDSSERKKITASIYYTMPIGEWRIGFYETMENDSVYVEPDSVRDIMERTIETVETVEVDLIVGKDTYKKEAYSAADFIEHLKPRPLKYIARYGLLKMVIYDPLLDEYVDEPPKKERDPLSDFDRNMLKAMNYNPKGKRETE
jgi:hypothetical protein